MDEAHYAYYSEGRMGGGVARGWTTSSRYEAVRWVFCECVAFLSVVWCLSRRCWSALLVVGDVNASVSRLVRVEGVRPHF